MALTDIPNGWQAFAEGSSKSCLYLARSQSLRNPTGFPVEVMSIIMLPTLTSRCRTPAFSQACLCAARTIRGRRTGTQNTRTVQSMSCYAYQVD